MRLSAVNFEKNNSSRFDRLGIRYGIALSLIAGIAVVGQIVIQSHLSRQRSDSHILNVAGRQRMLSQRITKDALLLRDGQSAVARREILSDLEESVKAWTRTQYDLVNTRDTTGLSSNTNDAIRMLFREVSDPYSLMRAHAQHLVAMLQQNPETPYELLRADAENIVIHEGAFVEGMEKIVLQYEEVASAKVASLRIIEWILVAVILLGVALEIVFIFWPTAMRINETIGRLVLAEKNATKLSQEIGALYASLEKSYEQIAFVNQPADNPRLLAKADRGGNITLVAEPFADAAGIHQVRSSTRICDLFPGMEHPDEWMDQVVETVSDGRSWQGEVRIRKSSQEDSWFDVVVTPVYNEQDEVEELLILGSDISRRKEAEQTMYRKNRAEIEKKINQQKFRSVLILEGQEEERKRIAMDIHDGIGQMLTSLKYQMESIDLSKLPNARQKISEADHLIKEIIREVRKVTFNLKPTVLGDYGLQAGLNVFIQEIGKLTGINLQYRTSGLISRLPQKVENNIFRITQEAINNAIKYSGAAKIAVSLKQTGSELVITVKDEGKGFDTELAQSRNGNPESGRGFFNMYERTEYINGKLEIQSQAGQGTTVRLTVPVANTVAME
jgi:signal transduction histidine kinase